MVNSGGMPTLKDGKEKEKCSTPKMYLQTNLSWNIIVPADKLDREGLMLQKAIITQLMDLYAAKKATEELGYFLAVTTVQKIGEGKVRQHTGDVVFPVDFSCITFKMLKGEVLDGTVHKILKHGILLKCGPADKIFLSHLKMAYYQYVPGENPYFINEKSSKIEKGVVVRFVVLGARFIVEEKEFQAIGSIEGDYLGPIS